MKFKKQPVPLLFKQSPIKSFRMWREALNHLTPLNHSEAKKSGHFWAVFGAYGMAGFILWQVPEQMGYKSIGQQIGFGIFVAALGYLQFCEWKNERQKVINLKEMQKQMEAQ